MHRIMFCKGVILQWNILSLHASFPIIRGGCTLARLSVNEINFYTFFLPFAASYENVLPQPKIRLGVRLALHLRLVWGASFDDDRDVGCRGCLLAVLLRHQLGNGLAASEARVDDAEGEKSEHAWDLLRAGEGTPGVRAETLACALAAGRRLNAVDAGLLQDAALLVFVGSSIDTLAALRLLLNAKEDALRGAAEAVGPHAVARVDRAAACLLREAPSI